MIWLHVQWLISKLIPKFVQRFNLALDGGLTFSRILLNQITLRDGGILMNFIGYAYRFEKLSVILTNIDILDVCYANLLQIWSKQTNCQNASELLERMVGNISYYNVKEYLDLWCIAVFWRENEICSLHRFRRLCHGYHDI